MSKPKTPNPKKHVIDPNRPVTWPTGLVTVKDRPELGVLHYDDDATYHEGHREFDSMVDRFGIDEEKLPRLNGKKYINVVCLDGRDVYYEVPASEMRYVLTADILNDLQDYPELGDLPAMEDVIGRLCTIVVTWANRRVDRNESKSVKKTKSKKGKK